MKYPILSILGKIEKVENAMNKLENDFTDKKINQKEYEYYKDAINKQLAKLNDELRELEN
jgi:hypothetical protein